VQEKLESVGVDETGIRALLSRLRVGAGIKRSEDIVAAGHSPAYSAVLLDGIACLYQGLPDGNRQIYAFQYAGDFCDINRRLLPDANKEVAVAAVTPCLIATISDIDLDRLMMQHPALATAMLRLSMFEARLLRKNLLSVARWSALQRVAHHLCEHIARQESVGKSSTAIALSGSDLADAAGLTAVHISRTLKELQGLRLLAKMGRTMKVVDRKGLAALADFDSSYLDSHRLPTNWEVEVDARPETKAGDRRAALPFIDLRTS
jgi:CRP-like cAMP-binding protein